MAWTAPTTQTTGTLITATIYNRDLVDNLNALRTGGIAIASQASLDFLYASSASQLARLAKGTARQFPRINAAANAYEFVSGTLEFIDSGSGSTTSASAENVDTTAISGLSALDRLLVLLTVTAVTQATAGVNLYNSTDSVVVNAAIVNPLPLGTTQGFFGFTSQDQSSNVLINSQGLSPDGSRANTATFTTAWTSPWTLALRQGGVTAGGSLKWSWAVYVIRGQ